MKKFLAVLLAVLMLVMCTACGSDKTENTTDEVYDINHVYELPEALADAKSENPVVYFSMNQMDLETGATVYLMAYADENGNCYVEYAGEEKKIGRFVPEAFASLAAEIENTTISSLNGQSVYEDGNAYASMYIELADGTLYSADFTGTVPSDFTDNYAAMEKFFLTLTEKLPIYVPQPVVNGDVDETVYTEMLAILNSAGIEGLDSFLIAPIEMDEYFAATAGLSDSEGITNGTICQPMMMTTPYSLVIVTVENPENTAAVRADFEASLDWLKWVCVVPSNALIAEKDNLVLCLVASDELYNSTADAVYSAGWTELTELDNPDM